MAATPRITIGFDLRGRSIRGVPKSPTENTVYDDRDINPPPAHDFIAENQFSVETEMGNDNQLLGVLGGRFNLGGKFLLNASFLWSMTDDGFKPKPTTVLGFDYVF